jgi:hypothetical protein
MSDKESEKSFLKQNKFKKEDKNCCDNIYKCLM